MGLVSQLSSKIAKIAPCLNFDHRMKLIQSIFLVLIIGVFGCQTNKTASKSSETNALFTVDNQVNVYPDEFAYMYEKNNFSNIEANTKEDILSYLELYKIFKLKIVEAQSLGMDTTEMFSAEFEKYKNQLTENYLNSNAITDSLIKEAYDRYTYEIKASHILIKVAPHEDTVAAYNKIIAARNRVVEGEDFTKVAKEVSEDPSAQINGGDLGYFTSMQMVYPFESAAFNTKVGEVSKPVRTQFGYHIIKVEDKRPSKGKLEVAHIMIRSTPNDSHQKESDAKDKIFVIREQLENGIDWDMACAQYSEVTNTKNNGGKLRPFGTGNMPTSFYDASSSLELPGEISDPFITPYGWHIIKLIRKIDLEPFEDMKGIISDRIKRDERVAIGQKALIAKLKRENGFIETNNVLELIETKVDSATFKPLNLIDSFDLFEIGTHKFTSRQFFDFLGMKRKPTSVAWRDHLSSTYESFSEESIVNYERAHLAEKNFEYKMLVNEYREGIMLFNLMDEKVWSKASKDTLGLQTYFDENRAKYKWKERAVVTIYSTSVDSISSKIKEIIASGDSSSLSKNNLESRYNKNSTLNLRIENNIYEKGVSPILNKVDWKVGTYEISENGMNYLIHIKQLMPESEKELNSIKGLVISDYQGYIEKKWVATLTKKYPITVNTKILNATISQLENK